MLESAPPSERAQRRRACRDYVRLSRCRAASAMPAPAPGRQRRSSLPHNTFDLFYFIKKKKSLLMILFSPHFIGISVSLFSLFRAAEKYSFAMIDYFFRFL
jgi:hypothetical protein